jgi:N-methylhydantoinase A
MARAIKAVSVERGHDPAGFVLVPFGGAGAMHACEIARELGMRRVLIPPAPGLLCAYGALAADTAHDFVHTLLIDAGPHLSARALAGELDRLTLQAEERLDADGVPAARRARQASATLRYQGQSFELAVPLDGPDTDLVAAFHEAHRARYGYAFDGVEPYGARVVELVTLRLRAIGVADVPAFDLPSDGTAEEPRRRTCVYRGRAYGAAVYARAGLTVGANVAGPALIVEYSATTFLPPDVSANVLPGGALLVTLF